MQDPIIRVVRLALAVSRREGCGRALERNPHVGKQRGHRVGEARNGMFLGRLAQVVGGDVEVELVWSAASSLWRSGSDPLGTRLTRASGKPRIGSKERRSSGSPTGWPDHEGLRILMVGKASKCVTCGGRVHP